MTRAGWAGRRRRPAPVPAAEAEPPPEPPPPRPPSKAEAAALADPVARMRQALVLLDGAELEPTPAYAFGTVRRRRKRVGHSLAQARAALRRALELAWQE